MIELIAIVACLAACIGTPIQTAKIRGGWMPKKFKGTRAEYIATYLKQLRMLAWVGLGLGVVEIGMIFIPDQPQGEWIAKLVGAVLWFTLSALCFFSQRSLTAAALPAPTA